MVLAVPPAWGELRWQRKSVSVEKALLYLLWFARGVTQCIVQDVRRLIITLPTDGAGKGRWPGTACTRAPRLEGWQPLLRGTGAAGHIPWAHGVTRGLWARPHAWGPPATIVTIWPQIVPGLLAHLPHSGMGRCAGEPQPPMAGGAGGFGVFPPGELAGGLFKFGGPAWAGAVLGEQLPPAPAACQNNRVGDSAGSGGAWGLTPAPKGKLRHRGMWLVPLHLGRGGRAPEHDPPVALPFPGN